MSGSNIIGTGASETLTGTAGDDTITAEGGNDRVIGLGGNDTIFGGDGNDTLYGDFDTVPPGTFPLAPDAPLNNQDFLITAGGHVDINFQNFTGNNPNNPGYVTFRHDGLNALTGVTVAKIGGSSSASDIDTLRFDLSTFSDNFTINVKTEGANDILMLDGVKSVRTISSSRKEVTYIGEDGDTYTVIVNHGKMQFQAFSDTVPFDPADSNDSIEGGLGNDSIFGGFGDDTLLGGEGNDTIFGGVGNDSIDGGPGDDSLVGGAAADTIEGGTGNDTIWGDFPNAGPGSSPTAPPKPGTNIEYEIVAGGDLKLSAASISGKGKDDAAYITFSYNAPTPLTRLEIGNIGNKAGDNDVLRFDLSTFSDNFTINVKTEGANDILMFEGVQTVTTVSKSQKVITYIGSDGNTYSVVVNHKSMQVEVHLRADEFTQADAADLLFGGEGDDFIDGGFADDTIFGGTGKDSLYGATGDDSIEAGDDDDFVDGGLGSDTIYGGAGDDTLFGDFGFDTAGGVKRAPPKPAENQDVTLTTGGDVKVRFDTFTGGNKNNAGYVTFSHDSATPLTKLNFEKVGKKKSDPDTIRIDLSTFSDNFEINVKSVGKNDVLMLDGVESVTRISKSKQLITYVGEDGKTYTVIVNAKKMQVQTFFRDGVFGSGDADFIDGGDGNDLIDGNFGDDTLLGGAGNDTIKGGVGNDSIEGQDGDDSLEGGAGSDTVFGGAGNDTIYGDFETDPTGTTPTAPPKPPGNIDFNITQGGNVTLSTAAITGQKKDLPAYITFTHESAAPLNSVLVERIGSKSNDPDVIRFELSTFKDNFTINVKTEGANDILMLVGVKSITTVSSTQKIATYVGEDGNTYTVTVNHKKMQVETHFTVDEASGAGNGDLLFGGEGDDLIDGGLGDDTIDGGTGNDTLLGGKGNDSIQGGDGDDSIQGGEGADTILGGAGNDTIYGDAPNGGPPPAPPAPPPKPVGSTTFNLTNAVIPNDGNIKIAFDQFTGGNKDRSGYVTFEKTGTDAVKTVLVERIGNKASDPDTVRFDLSTFKDNFTINVKTEGSNDILMLTGAKSVTTTSATQKIVTYEGSDGNTYTVIVNHKKMQVQTFFDAPPVDMDGMADVINGGDGNDSVFGGYGDDTITGGSGDTMFGGAGRDTFIIDPTQLDQNGLTTSDIYVDGGSAAVDFDTLDLRSYFGYRDLVQTVDPDGNSTSGSIVVIDDQLEVRTIYFTEIERLLLPEPRLPDGVVDGRDTSEVMNPGYTDFQGDQIDGTDGDNDVIKGNGGNDTINAGLGDDTVFGGTGNDIIDGSVGDDILHGDEGDDTLIGSEGNDTLFGGVGDDSIRGGIGDDSAEGGDGNDTIEGGDGNDILFGGEGDDSLIGDSGNDTLFGGEGDDTLFGGLGRDSLVGGDGDDVIFGGFGNDTLIGGDGDDFLSTGDGHNRAEGGEGNDTIVGGAENDTLFGDAGDDSLDGGEGDDELHGGEGDDELHGGEGDDTIIGGPGADTMFGGDGRDLFLVEDVTEGAGSFVYGGSGGDDFDTLKLGRGPWRIVDKVVDSDGNGFNGKVEFLDANGKVIGTLHFENIENIICFTPGTLIATPKGERPVESLRPGDRVITRDRGVQEIAWAGRRDLTGAQLAAMPHLRPVLIRAGSLGHGLPERDMWVSPNHRMLIANDRTSLYFEEREVLVAAKHLVGSPGIAQLAVPAVSYIHFMCENHEVVLADGAWTESFQPGDVGVKGVDAAQLEELYTLFPELRDAKGRAAYAAARRVLKGYEARLLASQFAAE